MITRDREIIAWRWRGGGGGWGKSQLERGGGILNLIHTGGHYFFHSFSQTKKKGRRAIGVLIFMLAYIGIKLEKYQLQVF